MRSPATSGRRGAEAGEPVEESGDAPVAEALVEDSAEVEQVEDEPAEEEPAEEPSEPAADDVSVEADADTVAHASTVEPDTDASQQSDS